MAEKEVTVRNRKTGKVDTIPADLWEQMRKEPAHRPAALNFEEVAGAPTPKEVKALEEKESTKKK